ncbi:MAG TPA: hypothetical protein ENJ09_04820 [Planctomycetes bacterium]|nr:hypothetical protein [Planctomycetota bacterium]
MILSNTLALLSLCAPVQSTQTSDQDLAGRVSALEAENAELHRRVDLLAEGQESFDLGEVVPELGPGRDGLGPAASKVYGIDRGVSIGGYGEAVYRANAGATPDQADLLRNVLYFGYRFDEDWVFNSEVEFEHASTESNGAVSVEFAYVDYRLNENTNLRGGLLLTPMGFVNELHEPGTFLSANRPETERRILPSTWGEMGVGVVGDAGPISYRAYLMNSFDAAGFDQSGLRDGRQGGSKAKADDYALVLRADWTERPGVVVGGSLYSGDAGQDTAGLAATHTRILEGHAEWRSGPIWARALYARADVSGVKRLNAFNGFGVNESVGSEQGGGYVEIGYEVLRHVFPDSRAVLYPFVRYEMVDTQADVPSGFQASGENDNDYTTVGLHFAPNPHIVIKLDYTDTDRGDDGVNLLLGYAF